MCVCVCVCRWSGVGPCMASHTCSFPVLCVVFDAIDASASVAALASAMEFTPVAELAEDSQSTAPPKAPAVGESSAACVAAAPLCAILSHRCALATMLHCASPASCLVCVSFLLPQCGMDRVRCWPPLPAAKATLYTHCLTQDTLRGCPPSTPSNRRSTTAGVSK